MKIAYCSDIHLEFGAITLKNTDNADVLILAGDIFVAKDILPQIVNDQPWPMMARSKRIHDFFEKCSKEFPEIIYIAGNHESYHGDIAKTYDIIREHLGYIDNLHILDNEYIEYKDVIFAGGTLWTDMNRGDIATIDAGRFGMNDFRLIKNSDLMVEYKVPFDSDLETLMVRKHRPSMFTPEAAIDKFKDTVAFLNDSIDPNSDKPVVVITHHSPSFRSVSEEYKNQPTLNGVFCSDLEQYIAETQSIKLWIHGHLHCYNDYMIGGTRILSNPRGYAGGEILANTFKLKTVEI